ncbi:hypothetical protein M569_16496, partial [Genlisea aurea]
VVTGSFDIPYEYRKSARPKTVPIDAAASTSFGFIEKILASGEDLRRRAKLIRRGMITTGQPPVSS